MNKEDLIKMKRKLETKVSIENAYGGSGELTQYEIEQRIDTLGAVQNVEKYFESVISYFSSKGMKYDEITLKPLFSLIVKEKYLDENTVIKPNAKPLPKIVAVVINGFYCINGEQKFGDDPDVIYPDNFNEYIVVFDDFIAMLTQRGFSFNGYINIEEIQDEIMAGHPTLSDITLTFRKKLVRAKQ